MGDMVGARECEVSGGGEWDFVVCPWRVAIGGCWIRYLSHSCFSRQCVVSLACPWKVTWLDYETWSPGS